LQAMQMLKVLSPYDLGHQTYCWRLCLQAHCKRVGVSSWHRAERLPTPRQLLEEVSPKLCWFAAGGVKPSATGCCSTGNTSAPCDCSAFANSNGTCPQYAGYPLAPYPAGALPAPGFVMPRSLPARTLLHHVRLVRVLCSPTQLVVSAVTNVVLLTSSRCNMPVTCGHKDALDNPF
jgi:hypothetical protein